MKRVDLVFRAREAGPSERGDLAERYHALHEEIKYYEGSLLAESQRLGDSYRRFTRKLRDVTDPLLMKAWEGQPMSPLDALRDPPDLGDCEDDEGAFLLDTRQNLG